MAYFIFQYDEKLRKIYKKDTQIKMRIGEIFSSHGVYLNKKISLHFSLQRGRENEKKLGRFDLDVEGCGHIARKLAVIVLAIGLVFLRKKQKVQKNT